MVRSIALPRSIRPSLPGDSPAQQPAPASKTPGPGCRLLRAIDGSVVHLQAKVERLFQRMNGLFRIGHRSAFVAAEVMRASFSASKRGSRITVVRLASATVMLNSPFMW